MVSLNEVWTFVILILLAFVIPILIILLTSADENFWQALNDLVMKGFLSLLLLAFSGGFLILGVIIAYSNPKIGKIIAYIGIGGVLFTLLFIEVSVTGITAKNRIKDEFVFETCKQLPVVKGDVASIADSLSCIITGYLPKNYSSVYLIGYWIFGIAIPLLITSSIFLDLVESSGIMRNKMSQKILGWGLGFMAYRGLVVSNLIYVIDFLSAGMAIIVLNFIFVGGLLAYTNRIFSQWKSLEDVIEIGKSIKVGHTTAKQILDQAISIAEKGDYEGSKTILNNFQRVFYQADPSGKLWSKITSTFSKENKDFVNSIKKIRNEIY